MIAAINGKLGEGMSSVRYRCLCQNCLRVAGYPTYDQANEAKCFGCGGEMCACGSCEETINALGRGLRDAQALGLKCDVDTWNPRDGGAFA